MKHSWQPDKELNEKVAKAMGWTQHDSYKHLWYGKGDQAHAQSLPNFSGDMTAAWIMVESIDGQWNVSGQGGIGFEVTFSEASMREDRYENPFHASADSAPLAICLAFLKSVGVE